MQTRNYQQPSQQQGFVLVLALLLMLFIGVIVISSAQKTGTETRVAQSEAPIATLQAAAEAGVFHFDQKAIDFLNKNPESSQKAACEAIEKQIKTESNLEDLLDKNNKGARKDAAVLFNDQGKANVYWYLDRERMEEDACDGNNIIIHSVAFAGPHDHKIAKIELTATMRFDGDDPYANTPLQDTPFKDVFDPENFTLKNGANLDPFYNNDFINGNFPGININRIDANATLGPNDFPGDDIHILVLDGDVSLTGRIGGKNIIIINRNDSVISFARETGQQQGRPNGWIIAPSSNIVTEGGSPHLPISVLVDGCSTGSKETCDERSGGSSFSGYDLLGGVKDNDTQQSSSPSTSIQFDY